MTRITVRQSVLPQILTTKSHCLWSGGKNAESIRGAGLRSQRGQAVCDEAVRMVNLARRCGALRLRNAGFFDYPFITASLFKLVISLQTGCSALYSSGRERFSPKYGWLTAWTDLAFPRFSIGRR